MHERKNEWKKECMEENVFMTENYKTSMKEVDRDTNERYVVF